MAIQKLKGKISQINILTPTVNEYIIEVGNEFEFKAGQFVNLSITHNSEILRKPYSICSNNTKSNYVTLCIKKVEQGNLTPKLFEKKIGEEVEIMGPLGLFTLDKLTKQKVVFIGTGTGIAPLKTMIYEILSKEKFKENDENTYTNSKEITLIFGCRFEDEILYRKEFEELEKKHANFKFLPIVSKPSENWTQRTGHVQNNLDSVNILESQFYMCGLPIMVEEVTKKLEELGCKKEDIFHEKFL